MSATDSESKNKQDRSCGLPAGPCSAPKRKRCYNCKHAGSSFKVCGTTNMHCEHPDDKISGAEHQNPWDTLRNFYDTCESWEAKPAFRFVVGKTYETQAGERVT